MAIWLSKIASVQHIDTELYSTVHASIALI
jgi:hypothetical protein